MSFSCTVERRDGSGNVLIRSSRATFWLSSDRLVRPDGSRVRWTDIHEGATGTAQYTNGNVTSVTLAAAVQPLPPEDVRKQFTESVLLYSKKVFPLSAMEPDYSSTPSLFTAMQVIGLKCVGVRRCAAGDEFGFWKAFRVAFIEYLARTTTPTSELQSFIVSVSSCGRTFPALHETLGELLAHKVSGKSGFQWIEESNTKMRFWDSMVEFLQHNVFLSMRSQPDYSAMLGDMDTNMIELLLVDPAFVEISIKILAETLRLKIIVYSPLVENFKRSYALEKAGERLPLLYLFVEAGSYHVLYSQPQLDVENYSLLELKQVATRALNTDATGLYTTVKERSQIATSLTDEIEVGSQVTRKLSLFCGVAEDYICALQALIRSRKVDFYPSQLTKSTLMMMEEYNIHLGRLSDFPDRKAQGSNVPLISRLENGPLRKSFGTEAIYKQLNLCDICQKTVANVFLDCSHAFCSAHINEHVQRSIDRNPLLLKADGETTEEFRCPVLSCFIRISGAKLCEIVGAEFFQSRLQYIEAATRTKCCARCRRVRQMEWIHTLCACGQAICMHCYCDFYRRNNGHCICGTRISEEVVQYLKNLQWTCAGCHGIKSLLTDFSHIECENHLLCRDCLSSIANAKGSKRCQYCYRKYSLMEVEDAQKLAQLQCAVCMHDCTRARLNTSCGCIICLNCARNLTVQHQQCTYCFLCSAQMSQQGYNQLFAFLPEENKEPEIRVFNCSICMEEIAVNDQLVLPCEDIFHRECFEENIQEMMKRGFSEMWIECPMRLCKKKMHIDYLKSQISQQLYGKYVENSLRGKSTPCPRCKSLVFDRDENDVKKSSVVCTKCQFHFCVECGEEFQQNHNKVRCKYFQVQELVRIADQVKSQSDTVAQCPNCKYPFIHTAGCHNVVCKTPSCGTKFCIMCSTPYYLYQMHGRAWHRPSCRHYVASDRRSKYNDNCMACVALKGFCTPPKDLRVPRRFALDEY